MMIPLLEHLDLWPCDIPPFLSCYGASEKDHSNWWRVPLFSSLSAWDLQSRAHAHTVDLLDKLVWEKSTGNHFFNPETRKHMFIVHVKADVATPSLGYSRSPFFDIQTWRSKQYLHGCFKRPKRPAKPSWFFDWSAGRWPLASERFTQGRKPTNLRTVGNVR